jgi:molybdopterin/thiamine biosynthesis adenylyltransferase
MGLVERFSRQRDLIKCDMSTPIMVVGAGGIGSFTVLTLAKMGFENIRVYDFDKVEEHNLPNQFYRIEDIGKYKVEALWDMVKSFTGTEVQFHAEKWRADDISLYEPRVLVSGVDNMTTRKDMFAACGSSMVFIDGRMGGDQAEVYTVNGIDDAAADMYRARLWDEHETSPLPCTSKATMYNVLTISSIIANQIRLALAGEPVRPGIIMDNKTLTMHYVK